MAAHRETVLVTTAGLSGSEDRKLRQRRYLITQGVRLCCFVLAVALPVPLWAKLVLIVGAFALPWIGVVAANAGPTLHRPRHLATMDAQPEPLPVALDPSRTIDQE